MKNKNPAATTGLPLVSSAWLVFWFFWPFGALIRAMSRFRAPHAKTVFWLFCVFFGFVFIIPEDIPGAADSARIATALVEAHKQPLSFSYLFASLYSPAGGLVDVYQPLVIWLLAIFTDDGRILFAIFAAVFGFFYAQNLWMVFSRISAKVGLLLFLFMLAYALTNPIWNINGVRMWTAAHIFLYGLLRVYLENDKKGMFWAAASILVHFSFMFPMALLLLFRFIPNNIPVLLAFYIVASFVNEISLEAVRNALGFLPQVFQPRVEIYTLQAVADARALAADETAWHVQFAATAGDILRYAWIIALFALRGRWSKKNPEILKLFALALFVGGFAQIAGLVPSGGRFEMITSLLIWGIVVMLMGQGVFQHKLLLLKLATYPLLAFSLIFTIRMGMDYFGIFALLSNPLIAVIFEDQIPFIEFVKQVF